MKSQFRDTFCGVVFLSILMAYTCCGCSKEAAVGPNTACYTCTVQQWQERQDGYASEDEVKTVELCGQTPATVHLYESKNTYNEKRPNSYGFLVMYHSRAACSKK